MVERERRGGEKKSLGCSGYCGRRLGWIFAGDEWMVAGGVPRLQHGSGTWLLLPLCSMELSSCPFHSLFFRLLLKKWGKYSVWLLERTSPTHGVRHVSSGKPSVLEQLEKALGGLGPSDGGTSGLGL